MEKNRYVNPEIHAEQISKNDILLQSDVVIDGSHLFETPTEE